ncbi:hypothetical protein EMMF5_003147 [Cystobasidiomycetes sp. EMM_F5]
MPPTSPARQLAVRLAFGLAAILFVKWIFFDGKSTLPPGEIAHSSFMERITSGVSLRGQSLDPRIHGFLQSRIGRRDLVPLPGEEEEELRINLAKQGKGKDVDGKKGVTGDRHAELSTGSSDGLVDDSGAPVRSERQDLFDTHIKQGLRDFWFRFQLPFATNSETVHLDEQVVKGVVDELMSFNGWAAAACSSLTRPFAASRKDDAYTDLTSNNQLYYFALVVHSADHFLIDQVASIVQLSRRLGPQNIFVSIIDYASTDSTPFLSDLTEMMFTLLGISFRIKRIPPMTRDPAAAYYPLEEAYTRNLAIEPLRELYHRRKVSFAKVIWLKGFTCPNDILETLRVAAVNKAAMTCSMDWKEHNGFFIYNDRWRTRDMDGNLFRGSKSTSPMDEAPPRDAASIRRYAQHLPFQVFCCESGVHIIDPSQSFYAGLSYRSSVEHGIFNISAAEDGKPPKWSEGPCMDSAQMHFCRDLWMLSAKEGVKSDAKRAREKERKGLPRGLSPEMEKIVKVVAPQYVPQDKSSGGMWSFGRKKPDAIPIAPDEDEEDDEEEEDVYEQGINADKSTDAAAADGAAGDKPAKDNIPDETVLQETAEEKKEKQEQLMAADAAAAALPADQQQAPKAVEVEVDAAQERVDSDRRVDPEVDGLPGVAKGIGEAGADALRQRGKRDHIEEFAERATADIVKRQDAAKAEAEGGADAEKADSVDADENIVEDDIPVVPVRGGRNRALKNLAFQPARIVVNPRCVTTYAGVSHTQLALDLFGEDTEDESHASNLGNNIGAAGADSDAFNAGGKQTQSFYDKYALHEFGPGPETFVCQEMRTSGGRSAPKQQRRTGFSIARGLLEGWQPQ